MTAEKSTRIGGTANFDERLLKETGLRELEINDTKLYAVARADYSRIVFQVDGIVYDMTCAHDYRTLVELCEHIL